jgi:hypothetical protein
MPTQPNPQYTDDERKQHISRESSALEKLQAQRLQRSGQRLHTKPLDAPQPAAVNSSTAHSRPALQPYNSMQQQQQPKIAVVTKQPTCSQQRLLTAQPAQLAAHARLQGSSITTGRITTTAGRGMQTKPPSRTGSMRTSLEVQQQQQQQQQCSSRGSRRTLSGIVWSSSHAATAAGSTAGSRSNSSSFALAGCSPAVDCLSVTTQLAQVPQLQVTGTGVQTKQQQQQLLCLQAQPGSSLATRQQHRLAQHKLAAAAAAAQPSSCAASLYLGCGVAWGQLAAQAALVAKRSLHHTNKEREQQR